MVMLRNLFKVSYQRAIVPDFYGFFELFYKKLIARGPDISRLFARTDMDRQVKMLMQSITHVTAFSATLEPTDELDFISKLHGRDKLDLPSAYYDIWLDCLLETVSEKDPKYDDHVNRAWRTVMAPGIEYMKSFCSR
ncbi:MAG: hemoglobin-like flavoprotein [Gammaproteobacteria bacterium]|nr:hemoglobin-like flavoprotein [Gammaproteobacteria bacterium]